ncbi:MAG: site-specific integrase [Eubacteriales bacterium]|nr:site-specific integrase [Eubacteriales bacterium]
MASFITKWGDIIIETITAYRNNIVPFPVTLVEEDVIEFSKSSLILYEEGYNMSIRGDIEEILEKMKRKQEVLNKHKYAINECSDGRYSTKVYDSSCNEGRKTIKAHSYDELIDKLYKHYNSDELRKSTITIRELYPEWLEYKKLKTPAETTIDRIETMWKNYYLSLDLIDIPIRNINRIMLETWANQLVRDLSCTQKKYGNHTAILNQVLEFAVDKEIISANPMKRVHIEPHQFTPVKKKPDSNQIFYREELARIFEMAWEDFYSERNRLNKLAPLALIFQFQTGMRASEICALKWSDIEETIVHVQRFLRRDYNEIVEHTKGSYGDRNVPLVETALNVLKSAREKQEELGVYAPEGYIFSVTDNPLSWRGFTDLYPKYCKRLGIPKRTSHAARRTYISMLLNKGISHAAIQRYVGHIDEQTTLNNYHYDTNTADENYAVLSKVLNVS